MSATVDDETTLLASPLERQPIQHGKSSRFQVRKLYDRLHLEVTSHMEAGNSEIAVNLIRSRKTEVNNADETGLTLLMTACSHGDKLVVRALIEEFAAVNAADNDSWTPLMYASRDGHVEVITELLDAGADLELRDVGGWTALMWACYKGRTACVEELIKRGANVNIKAMHSMTCLHWAAGRGHTECAVQLLAAGAKVDATDKYGSTPLIWAARKGFLPIADTLIKHGASADAVGMYSWTPLLVALQGGHVQVATAILATQPNLNATDKAGMTALALAAKAGYDDIVIELLKQGAYLNMVDKNGDTVLHHATKGGHVDIVRMLLRKNPDIDARGEDGKTVLYLAVDKGNTALVKCLLATDPDKELTDKDGNTPLLRAVRNRSCEMAYLLVEKGAKVSAVDLKGDTGLHIAMRARNRRMLELLLKNPSNSRYLYIRNRCGETPYSIDSSLKRSLLSHIFGARSLNSQEAVESQLGYELYSSSLADILSSPTLNTPMTVGLFAKWGSGKSFMLNKLKEDMQAYMKQSPQTRFQFSWFVFFINFTAGLLLGLVLALMTQNWKVGVAVGAALLLVLYVLQAVLYCVEQRKNWDWIEYISHTVAKKIQKVRLLLYLLFYNRPPPPNEDFNCHSISFVFAESTKITSLGGEQSLASMIGSLFDALEKRYGVMVTRLYKVFGSDREWKGRFKKLCCIPYFIIVIFVLICLITAVGMFWVKYPVTNLDEPANIVMLALICVVGLALLLSIHTIGRAIAAYAYSPKRRTTKASQCIDVSKSDHFLHVLRNEVQLLSSLVTTMDRHESWQTRLVLIIDGLDSCEQDKVLQVLDAMSLIIPENSQFIILLALDPHVIVKGIEANQLQALRDQSLNGYGYLRNIVHLPFYLQNHGLPRMYTASESAQLRRWQSATGQSKQKSVDKGSVVSSTMSLEQNSRNHSKKNHHADSMSAVEPLHHFVGEMPKNIMKNDYFVDINPRSMRRLMNIIALAGRLLRANDIDFNWYRLSAWINITEQWPYRTSWILLYYEEMEGKLDDNLSLLSIYEIVKERMPVLREAEPLLDIDRNEKKFLSFLKSHVPRLNVDDIKKFTPATINLDPFLRKLIKEKSRDAELLLPENARLQGAQATGYFPPRFTLSQPAQPTVYNSQLCAPFGSRLTQQVVAYPQPTLPPSPNKHRLPKDIKALSTNTVSDICDLLHSIKAMSTLNLDTYKTAILLHNINGAVLAECDLNDLKPVLQMKFGDWQLFQTTILAMREIDNGVLTSTSNPDLSCQHHAPPLPIPTMPLETDDSNRNHSGNCSVSSYPSSPGLSRQPSLRLISECKAEVDTSLDAVLLENQMIMSAVHDQLVSSDEEESHEGYQNTVKDLTQLSAELSRMQLHRNEEGAAEPKTVKFHIVNESKEAARALALQDADSVAEPLVDEGNATEQSCGAMELKCTVNKLYKANSVSESEVSLPVIAEYGSVESLHQGGLDNRAFQSDE